METFCENLLLFLLFFDLYVFSPSGSVKCININSKSVKKDGCERIFYYIVYLIYILNDNFYHVFVEIVTEGKRKKSSSSELHKVCMSFPFNLFIIRVTNIESILLFVF